MKIGGLILAAGCSRRFGSDKRQLYLANGLSMLEYVVKHSEDVLGDCIVVVDDEAWREKLIHYSVEVVVARNASQGMGHSLAAGSSKANELGWDGLLVLLADMPFVQAQTIDLIRKSLLTHDIVVPVYCDESGGEGKKWGHPVGFKSRYFAALASLEGDSGARAIIDAQVDHRLLLDVEDRGVLQDIDTPLDWQSLIKSQSE